MSILNFRQYQAVFLLAIAYLLLPTRSQGQTVSANWHPSLNKSVSAFKTCDQTVDGGVNPCSKYTGEAVKTVYQVNDFYSSSLGRYMTGSEINKYLHSTTKWKKIGNAFDQKALAEAQHAANDKKAVVATYIDDTDLGHVSIVIPGDMVKSGSWGLEVPNSTSFFMHKPENSYTNKALSYAFPRSTLMKVELYVREY